MKNLTNQRRKGFTLIELLTSVAITTVIITVLIGMTRMSVDAWKNSRDQARAARIAQEGIESLAKDMEGIVFRTGNQHEWAFINMESADGLGPASGGIEIQNPTELVFFSAATDRYDGRIGEENIDNGGDVSTVAYRLVYKDVFAGGKFPVFSLYRQLVNPDDTYNNYLSQPSLQDAFDSTDKADTLNPANFLVENVLDLTVTFLFEYYVDGGNGVQTLETKRVCVSQSGSDYQSINIYGDRILVNGEQPLKDRNNNKDISQSARLAGAELSLLVLSDTGMNALRNRKFPTEKSRQDFLKENSYHYGKTVLLPKP